MHKFIAIASLTVLMAGALSAAAGATIQLKNGPAEKAYDIKAETVSGVIWDVERGRPGTRIKPWEFNDVSYTGSTMDQYNGLSRKLKGGLAAKLRSDAQEIKGAAAPSGFDNAQWDRMKLSLDYYIAMADYLEGDWSAAVSGLESYIKAAEKNLYTEAGIVPRTNFKSEVSGQQVTNAGGLNRFYLDALESLGLAYLKQGDAAAATKKAFGPLQVLTEELSKNSGDSQYFDWGIRALRASADYAQTKSDFKGARESYEALARVALKKNAGRPSRTSYEAQLKVGFMQVKEGDTRGANARFYEAVRTWENDHKSPPDRAWQPRNNWIDADTAYLTAGSYLGQGLVKAADARRADDWAEALKLFSTSLSIFNADDEIRSMALLGAANAAAQLAELNKDVLRKDSRSGEMVPRTSDNYARLAEKYLSELTTLLPKSKAAEDDSIPAIQKLINTHRHD